MENQQTATAIERGTITAKRDQVQANAVAIQQQMQFHLQKANELEQALLRADGAARVLDDLLKAEPDLAKIES